MIRKRLAALALVAGLGLLSGCSSSPMACGPTIGNGQLWNRLCGRTRTAPVVTSPVVETGSFSGGCDSSGPILMDRGPVFSSGDMHGTPSAPCPCNQSNPFPGGTVPFPGTTPFPSTPTAPFTSPGNLAPTPRLVPEPQAQVRPYTP